MYASAQPGSSERTFRKYLPPERGYLTNVRYIKMVMLKMKAGVVIFHGNAWNQEEGIKYKPAEIKNIYQEVINHHAESIINGTPLLGGDAVHNLKLCEAAHKSAQNNGAIIEVK